MQFSAAEQRAMLRALELASTPGVPLGPNPRVGCVLLDADGNEVAEGYHRGAGTPHAEAVALVEAGAAASGTTAVVTLEPCHHTGRTGPCSQALIDAGVARVVFAQPDPNPVARGGGDALRQAGIDVDFGLREREAERGDQCEGSSHPRSLERPLNVGNGPAWPGVPLLRQRSAA